MAYINEEQVKRKRSLRLFTNQLAQFICMLSTLFGIIVLGILIYRVVSQGIGWIDINFLTGKLSTQPEKAGILGVVLGTFWLMIVVVPITMILGVGTALFLEVYVKKGRIQSFLQTNIANLAGIPSIVYGILGMTIFVRALDLGNIVLAGGLTMSLLTLPIVIVASQEAIHSVPQHLSEASYGIGATKWQTIRHIIIPVALPGILTGAILSFSRAIGETAPLVVIGIPALLIPLPGGIFDKFTVLPMQIYYWTLDASLVEEYAHLAAATIIVLLLVLFLLNLVAIIIRQKFKKTY